MNRGSAGLVIVGAALMAAFASFDRPAIGAPIPSPQTGPRVQDGPIPEHPVTEGEDLQFTPQARRIAATWQSTDPEEVDAVAYEWSISTQGRTGEESGDILQDWTNVGLAFSASNDGLTLSEFVRYYVSVRAVFEDGSRGLVGVSDGVTVDLRGPVAGWVRDGGVPGTDIDSQYSATTIDATWGGFTDYRGVGIYEWAIGTSPGGIEVQPFTRVIGFTAWKTGLSLTVGRTYYVSVRGIDEAGNIGGIATSDGVTLLGSVGPTGGKVEIHLAYRTLLVTWSGFEGGVAGYKWAIRKAASEDAPHEFLVQGYVDVGTATSASRSDLWFEGTYYVTVIAYSAAGIPSPEVFSAPVRRRVGTKVCDGTVPDVDADFQNDTTRISASWSGFSAGDDIVRYEYAILQDPGNSWLTEYRSAGLATSISVAGLPLVHGSRYCVLVRAVDLAGNVDESSSDSVLVDAVPPGVETGAGIAATFHQGSERIDATWSGCFDDDSGLASYEWSIGLTPGGSELRKGIQPSTSLRLDQSVAGLVDWEACYVSVRPVDKAGNVGPVLISGGMVIDTRGPAPGRTNDGAGKDIDHQSSADRIDANWSGFHDGSGIAAYDLAIGTTPGGEETRSYTRTDAAGSASVGGLSLDPDVTYFVSIRAIDKVGHVGLAAVSNGVKIYGWNSGHTKPCGGSAVGGTGAGLALALLLPGFRRRTFA